MKRRLPWGRVFMVTFLGVISGTYIFDPSYFVDYSNNRLGKNVKENGSVEKVESEASSSE